MLADYHFNAKRNPFHTIAVLNKQNDNQDQAWDNWLNIQREWYRTADWSHKL